MDSTCKPITFDDSGKCNYCSSSNRGLLATTSPINLDRLIKSIKREARSKEYDCILGLSGGLDSCWLLHSAVQLGLRPLVVHMDNGWNTEIAQSNMHNLLSKLNLDLITYVINWDEYRDYMRSFLQADVVDIELLMDNAALAVCYRYASKYNIKYILQGTNKATEGLKMPATWNWYKYDKLHIQTLYRKYSKKRSKSYPAIGTLELLYYKHLKKIRWCSFLDYLHYNKDEALSELIRLYDFKPYPYKHYELVFTRFYQGYILPHKFKFDKRRHHLSCLICSGHITRCEALETLKHSPYSSQAELNLDRNFVLKKLGISFTDFEQYLSRPPLSHRTYINEYDYFVLAIRLYKSLFAYYKKLHSITVRSYHRLKHPITK